MVITFGEIVTKKILFRRKQHPEGKAALEKEMSQEVDDKLSQGILAMSVDRLRSQYCKPVLLTFTNSRIERKVNFDLTEYSGRK